MNHHINYQLNYKLNHRINYQLNYQNKFFIKLRKTNIISLTYHGTVNRYTNKYLNKSSNKSPNIIITDTSLIINKLGIDNIGYNPQLLKHKTFKIIELFVFTISFRI